MAEYIEKMIKTKYEFDKIFYSEVWSVPDLKSMLRSKNVADVTIWFKKVDGSTRQMRCTLRADLLPEFKASTRKYTVNEDSDRITVYDLDKNDWRSFHFNSIEKIAIGKTTPLNAVAPLSVQTQGDTNVTAK